MRPVPARTRLLAITLVFASLTARQACAEGPIEEIATPLVPEMVVIDFPDERPPLWSRITEAAPTALSWPHQRLAHAFGLLLHTPPDRIKTELDEEPLGLLAIPERPRLLLEWNEHFLGNGFLPAGFEMPGGAVWRPALWVFGEYRTAIQHFDRNRSIDPVSEWANRLDLFGQLNLSGTERLLVGLRPLDRERGANRNFTGYDFRNGRWLDGGNARFQTLFFEGDFGELFPFLDPSDSHRLDYGFSAGRMPLLAQQGLLINEDMIDAVTVTRNTLSGWGNLNLRISGVFSWRGINRNSNSGAGNQFDPRGKMVAMLTESDYAERTINVDAAYAYGDASFGDLFACGISSIKRHHLYRNTYNTSVHLLASFPCNRATDFAGQGELIFLQTSWTPHHTDDLIYFNGFWAIDQFTSPARGPLNGGPLGQTGILFSAAGVGRYGAPIAITTNDAVGASLGYQMFFDQTRQQVVWEFGGAKETHGVSRGAIGTALRYQRAVGQHVILVLDGFVSKQESNRVASGGRTELRIKF